MKNYFKFFIMAVVASGTFAFANNVMADADEDYIKVLSQKETDLTYEQQKVLKEGDIIKSFWLSQQKMLELSLYHG